MKLHHLIAISVLCITAMHSAAQSPPTDRLSIDDPWARALPPVADNGAAYLRIVNHAMHADTLLSATSPIAGRVEFHTHVRSGAMMMMKKLDTLPIGAHGTLTMAPGGTHVMLFGLKIPLTAGDVFGLSLNFEKAGKTEVTVKVEARTAQMPAMKQQKSHHQYGKKH
jgi:copper(I)-binding protein